VQEGKEPIISKFSVPYTKEVVEAMLALRGDRVAAQRENEGSAHEAGSEESEEEVKEEEKEEEGAEEQLSAVKANMKGVGRGLVEEFTCARSQMQTKGAILHELIMRKMLEKDPLELCKHVFSDAFGRACFSAYHTQMDASGMRFPKCLKCDRVLVQVKRELDEGVAAAEVMGEELDEAVAMEEEGEEYNVIEHSEEEEGE